MLSLHIHSGDILEQLPRGSVWWPCAIWLCPCCSAGVVCRLICEPGVCYLPWLSFPQCLPKMTAVTMVSWDACSLAILQAWLGLRGSTCFGECFLTTLQPHTFQFTDYTALWAACSSYLFLPNGKQCIHPFFFLAEYLWEIQLCPVLKEPELWKSTWAQTFQSFRFFLSMVLSFPRLSSTAPLPFSEMEMYPLTTSCLPLLLPGYELFLTWLAEMGCEMDDKIFSVIRSVNCHTKFSGLSVFSKCPEFCIHMICGIHCFRTHSICLYISWYFCTFLFIHEVSWKRVANHL